MAKISFILPCYCAERYLEHVVNSLKTQTMTGFEAIFVDDGSPDNGAALSEKLFDGDSRFVLIRKKNGGVSSARNEGLSHAHGKYIFFVDPDDFIEKESAEILLSAAEKNDADIVFFGRSSDVYSGGKKVRSKISMPKAEGAFFGNPCRDLFDKIATAYFVTDKLFKRDIIEKNNIRFCDMNIGEDGVFIAEYIRCDIKCAVFLKKALYHYTVDESETLSSYHAARETDNFRLSKSIMKTVDVWGLSDSPMHNRTVKYCIVRDLQLGIKNINLSKKTFREKYMWLKKFMRDTEVCGAVCDTQLNMVVFKSLGLDNQNRLQRLGDVTIYPTEYFNPKELFCGKEFNRNSCSAMRTG